MPNRSLSLRESSSGDESHSRGAKGDHQGSGSMDYALWGDNGKPLGLIEAKRTKRSPKEGEHQAKLYADCLNQNVTEIRYPKKREQQFPSLLRRAGT